MASDLYDPTLMKGERAKAAASKAASVADQRKFNFRYGGHTAFFLIRRMISPHIRQIINLIHFLCGKRLLRWILNHINAAAIFFCKGSCGKRIRILILYSKALCILSGVCFHFLISGKQDRIIFFICKSHNTGNIPGLINGSRNIGNILNVNSAIKSVSNFYNRTFSHAIRN